jgi:hypothetical protein
MGKSATKWQFNLHLQDKECWKQEILIWKNGRREAIVVDVVLDLSDLEDEVDLVVDSSVKEKKMVTIPKSSSVYAAKAVVLESWTIRMGPEESVFLEEFPSLYKKASAFIRTVYFTTRILPFTELSGNSGNSALLACRWCTEYQSHPQVLRWYLCQSRFCRKASTKPSVKETSGHSPRHTGTTLSDFSMLSIEVEYRTHVNFEIRGPDSLNGTKLLEMDEDFFRKDPAMKSQLVMNESESISATFGPSMRSKDEESEGVPGIGKFKLTKEKSLKKSVSSGAFGSSNMTKSTAEAAGSRVRSVHINTKQGVSAIQKIDSVG